RPPREVSTARGCQLLYERYVAHATHDDEQRCEKEKELPLDIRECSCRVAPCNGDEQRGRGDPDERQREPSEPAGECPGEDDERLGDERTVEGMLDGGRYRHRYARADRG